MKSQQNIFRKGYESSEKAVDVSIGIFQVIAPSSKSFTYGDFAKYCLYLATKKFFCTNCAKMFEAISLSRVTDLANDVQNQFSELIRGCVYYSLAAGE